MKERPILFSALMVRAILEGRKTQTRRAVKPCKDKNVGCDLSPREIANEVNSGDFTNCPYGQPGNQLWVRENWAINDFRYMEKIPKSKPLDMEDDAVVYAATEDDTEIQNEISWRPSIHMPRWASRIQLEITNMRVQRLQLISRGDAMAEGCPFPNMAKGDNPCKWYAELWDSINGNRPILPKNKNSKRYTRIRKWLDTHPESSWNANPWVWVIEFKRVMS